MAKQKEIRYPTPEWIDKWIDGWMDKHPDERVSDFKELQEQAEEAWWMNEIDHDRPTPFDLNEEQKQAQKQARKGMARAVNAYGKEVKRERKADPDKRALMVALMGACPEGAELTNPERQIDFEYNGKRYSVTLTQHRPPKG